MNRSRILSAVVTIGLIGIFSAQSVAQLSDFVWNPASTGSQQWQIDTNWTAPVFPGGYPYASTTTFPNDPGRVDSDSNATTSETTDLIEWPSVGANLSVALGANLTVDVGGSNVTVASLKMGGTAGAVTTNITSSVGKLVFENYEVTRTNVSPDACAFNCSAALVTSAGVAGSTNIISAPIQINGERLEFSAASTNNLTISGPISFANLTTSGSGFSGAPGATSIRSFMPPTTKLTISGSISLVDTVTGLGVPLILLDSGTLPSLTAPPESVSNPSTGTIEISGVIQDTAATGAPFGSLVIGSTSATNPISNLILSGNNTFRGQTTLNKVNLFLGHNNVLGVDSTLYNDRSGGASMIDGQAAVGNNLWSTDDARTISIDTRIAQYRTVRGDHSLTWAGLVTQSNNRGWINLLPAGKQFNVVGPTWASSESSGNLEVRNRIFSFDGSGLTVVTGGLHDRLTGGVPDANGSRGHYRKAGTGTVLVSDSPVGSNTASDFTGDVLVDQGVIRFASSDIFDQGRFVTSVGGAIGVDTGTFSNSTLLQKLDTSGLLANSKLNHGGLMLTTAEANANIPIDFTSGDLANISNMSVAPPENGATYDGIITPAPDQITTVPTYRLGGGNAKLTLPGAKLTGANNVQITNGGEVALLGANTYSGVTRIQAKYHSSMQAQGIADTTSNVSTTVYEGTTLTVNTLLSGGTNSSIGSSSSNASNLVIQGSTLKYAGTGTNGTTNRLFTVGTGGATIDASGDVGSAMNFTNSGPLVMGLAGALDHAQFTDSGPAADGLNDPAGITVRTRVFLHSGNVDDLVNGMTIFGPAPWPVAGVQFTQVNNPLPNFPYYQLTIPQQTGFSIADFTATFGGVARTLTLSGDNTSNNTLSPTIGDAAAASGSNVVNVAKSGAGKWILTGNNSYTGTTTVNAGTLLINGTQTGTGLTTVTAGATLGGTGTLGGALTNNGTVSPGASVGTLTVNGTVTMGASSHFAVELSGATADKLAITGNLDLSASANFLDVTGPGTGSSWVIATYTGTLSGAFENIPSGYSVDYGTLTNSQVTLNLTGVPGDYNGNGIVDAADYVVWRKNNGTLSGATASMGDGDGDGDVDNNDYNYWRARFGNTSGAGSGAGLNSSIVPEPSSMLLISITLIGTLGRVRRRS